MAVVDYAVANGRILSENRGGTRRTYRADALGSTVALYDNSQAKTDTFTYWPYGEARTSSGSTGTKYKYVGTLGCRTQSDGGIYMRARVVLPKDGRWMTVDSIWAIESAYLYVLANPTSFSDSWGLYACQYSRNDPCASDKSLLGICIAMLCSFGNVKEMIDDLRKGLGIPDDELRDGVKKLKKLWGKKYSPEDCCRKAHGHPKGPGVKFDLQPPFIHFVPPEVPWIVLHLCKAIVGKSSKGYCFFVCRSKSPAECFTYCDRFSGTIRDNCRIACDESIWGENGVWSTWCRCGEQGDETLQ